MGRGVSPDVAVRGRGTGLAGAPGGCPPRSPSQVHSVSSRGRTQRLEPQGEIRKGDRIGVFGGVQRRGLREKHPSAAGSPNE